MSNFIEDDGLIHPMEDIPGANSKFIKPIQEQANQPKKLIRPMTFEAKPKGPEEKIYIIFYNINNDDEDNYASKIFSISLGRTCAYNDIKNKLLSGLNIDVHRSYVMTETIQTVTETGDIKYYMIPYEECISVYSFCISISNFYSDDDFDIEDYASGDVPENDKFRDINSVLSADQINYRKMLEEALSRDKFINNMRDIYGSKEFDNI